MARSPDQTTFGLLPQPEGRIRSFVASSVVNLTVFGVALYAGISAHQVMQEHYEVTELIVPAMPPAVNPHKPQPAPPLKIHVQPPHIEPPKPLQEAKLEEAKLEPPPMPSAALAPRPKPASAAAMPAEDNLIRPSVKPVHLGDTFGVVPNPNSVRPATIASLGNPYGGYAGPGYSAPRRGGIHRNRRWNSIRFGRRWQRNRRRPGRIRRHARLRAGFRYACLRLHGAPIHQRRNALQAARAIHCRGPSVTRRGRNRAQCHFSFERPGPRSRRAPRSGPRPRQEAIRVAQQIRFRPATAMAGPWT